MCIHADDNDADDADDDDDDDDDADDADECGVDDDDDDDDGFLGSNGPKCSNEFYGAKPQKLVEP